MTTELTKTAQQALEALTMLHAVYAAVRLTLHTKYPDDGWPAETMTLDQAKAAITDLERALTQRPAAQQLAAVETLKSLGYTYHGGDLWKPPIGKRPAAQTEREAPYGYCPECGAPGVMRERRPNGDDSCSNGHRYPSRTARASLPAPKQATPATPEDMKVYDGIATGYFADAQQATPEPVGEVFHAADGGDDETGAGYHMKACVRWKNRGLLPAGTKLFTRPAPGVPEGFALASTGLSWDDCLLISENPDVDEALRLFADGETTADQAVCIVQAVLAAAHQATKEPR